jgi:branched-chain amino acid transport system permease protein
MLWSRVRELTAPAWWPIVILIAVTGVSMLGSVVVQRQAIEVLIYVTLTVGLYIFAGNTGVLSFGHMSFMAIGAYATALLTIPLARREILLPELPSFLDGTELPAAVAVPVAGLVACALGAVIVVPICRLSGLAASLAMFAVLVIVYEVAIHWDSVTRGSQAMIGVPNSVSVGAALTWASVAVLVAAVYQGTSAGLRVRATREDELGAAAAGISVTAARVIPFILSALIIGIAGSLYAQVQGAFTPSSFYLKVTFLTIAMLVVGGMKSLAGAVVGALVISISRFAFEKFETGFDLGTLPVPGRPGLSEALLASLILVVLWARREGLMQGRELLGMPRRHRQRIDPALLHAHSDTTADRESS